MFSADALLNWLLCFFLGHRVSVTGTLCLRCGQRFWWKRDG